MDRLLQHDAAMDAQICAIFPERRVQRGKYVAAHVGVAAEMLLDAFGRAAFPAAIDGLGQ